MLRKNAVGFFITILIAVNEVEMKSKTTLRIINGTIAQFNGTRYQVSIRLKLRDWYFGAGHICGGTLLSSTVALTAAHCVWDADEEVFRNASELNIVLGGLNRFSKDNTISYEISRYEFPQTFNISSYKDDICILFLSQEVPTDYIGAKPIKINRNTQIKYGTICQVTGWGETETRGQSEILRILDVPLLDQFQCKKSYGDLLQDSMICAGYINGERDACFGDSGGPLVCNGILYGVISTGYKCALPEYPGIYTNVALFSDWIQAKTGIENGTKKFTTVYGFLLLNIFLLQIVFG